MSMNVVTFVSGVKRPVDAARILQQRNMQQNAYSVSWDNILQVVFYDTLTEALNPLIPDYEFLDDEEKTLARAKFAQHLSCDLSYTQQISHHTEEELMSSLETIGFLRLYSL